MTDLYAKGSKGTIIQPVQKTREDERHSHCTNNQIEQDRTATKVAIPSRISFGSYLSRQRKYDELLLHAGKITEESDAGICEVSAAENFLKEI